jgi:hypothetical protein
VKDGRDLWFLVNSTDQVQTADVSLRGELRPVRWDTSLGEEQPIAPSRLEGGFTRFQIELPPVGSVFITTGEQIENRIVETNVLIDRTEPTHPQPATQRVPGPSETGEGACSDHQARLPSPRSEGRRVGDEGRAANRLNRPQRIEILGRVRGGNAHAVIAKDRREHRLTVETDEPLEPLVLDGAWEFVAEDANALVIAAWLATPEEPGAARETYVAPNLDTTGWLPMVMGAWSYQLPAKPDRPYPIDVWYRIGFTVERVPSHLDLIVDGFAGSGWDVFVNGEPVTATPVRSAIDSQMQALEITPLVRQGKNVIAVRLTVTKATDGLLGLVKLMGDFAVARVNATERIGAPGSTLQPASWVEQGYPYYSGRGLYRRQF